MIVCIDAHPIIWGIKKQSTTGQEDMIGKAEYFFHWVDEQKHDVIIPAIVVAEILAPEPVTTHSQILEVLNQNRKKLIKRNNMSVNNKSRNANFLQHGSIKKKLSEPTYSKKEPKVKARRLKGKKLNKIISKLKAKHSWIKLK